MIGKNKTPSVGIIDSQSVKNYSKRGSRGYDAGKNKGQKTPIIVDTVGLVIAAEVHSASIQDRDSALNLLPAKCKVPTLRKFLADQGYIENKALKIENAELRERLGLSSKNSSIPSSKELYKIKRISRKAKGIGGQVGHKGSFRANMDADEGIKVELSSTCECRGRLQYAKPYIQKVDLPEIKPYVVEYQPEHGRCRKCGKEEAANYQKVLHQIHLDQGLSQNRSVQRVLQNSNAK
ncbi:IS66 family transposase [Trichonephila inaurata madagascariensis]|uniref:IS66 family transposase n=1 Tax=Trichonephila inaurata madagascariensis TaxID=2747483 RepID=A0A8X7CHY4_9ARAC|nr:IS66 family transposase [Trichonephila inaurata madagascariensis]